MRIAIQAKCRAWSGVLFLLSLSAYAADQRMQCPLTTLPSEAVSITSAPTGWIPYTAGGFKLTSIGFGSGPPASQYVTAPDSDVKTKNGQEVTYLMHAESKEGNWMLCNYGDREQLVLGLPLGTRFDSCKVIYQSGRGRKVGNAEVFCQSNH